MTEFFDKGESCHYKHCRQFDFLPIRCDVCTNSFCKNHSSYESHDCEKSSNKNIVVPQCPLCNTPIPVPKGCLPDDVVSEHLDRKCYVDRKEVYSYKCSKEGCRKKELVPITCPDCKNDYCLVHRHFLDHNCKKTRSKEKASFTADAPKVTGRSRETLSKQLQITSYFTRRSEKLNHKSSIAKSKMNKKEDCTIG